jgi:hypothetical protein
MKLKFISACALLLGGMAIVLHEGCKPENVTTGNGLTASGLTAAFTVTPVTGKTNTYALKADETNALGFKWDKGDGSSAIGKALDTVVLPDAGKYTIVLTALGKGGASVTASQDITVATSDPLSGNLVQGGKFGVGDDAKWIHFNVGSGNQMVINTAKGVMTSNQTGFQAGGVAQLIALTAGKKYMVDMTVMGSGMTNSWFEVWVDTKAPVNGQDYNTGKKPISLLTYSGCGIAAFNGKLAALSCSGDGDPFTVPTTGNYYLVIKNGGENTGVTGISFTNVTLRGVN